MVVVKLPDVISGSKTSESILSKRVIEWPVISVGSKIEGINENLMVIIAQKTQIKLTK